MKHRMMIRFVFVLLVAAPSVSFAQRSEYPSHEKTNVPAESRFEIVQSSLAAKITLKVDKYLGVVYQLVEDNAGEWSWSRILKLPHPLDKNPSVDKVNYQVFTSGKAAKFTFLLNVNTGATWTLSEDTKEKRILIFWSPVE